MPKEGYETITIPDVLHKQIFDFVEKSGGLVGSKTQALSQAWQFYEKTFLTKKKSFPCKNR